MKKMAILLLLLAVMGCASHTKEDFKKIKNGTPAVEIKEKYGEPDEIKYMPMKIEYWIYESVDCIVVIANESVVNVDLSAEKTLKMMEGFFGK
jgi:carbonic anhydrase